jgi:hypothetical protein
MTDRRALLMDLADAINELTRPRQHTEYVEQRVTEPTVREGRKRAKSGRVRRAHHVTMPPLLKQLADASVPGSGISVGGPVGFESRPSAELEPLSVLRDISDRVGFWVRVFDLDARKPLPDILSALVSAPHDDEQLASITRQAVTWVRQARIATGLEPAPITLGDACPYCWVKNSLTIAGDLRSARCGRCGKAWDVDTIGLLADMLRANQEQPTLVEVPCWQPECTRIGPHAEHQDVRGRTWGDVCLLGERIGA